MRWFNSKQDTLPSRGEYRSLTAAHTCLQHEGCCKGQSQPCKTFIFLGLTFARLLLGQLGVELTVEERNLLSVSYKNVRRQPCTV